MAFDLKQVLEIINSGDWFHNLRFITADVTKGSGGKVIELPKARLSRKFIAGIRQQKREEMQSGGMKNPNHHKHFTVNLELPNSQIVKVHPILITHINNTAVV